MFLVIFLIVWPFSFIWLHIDSGSHFSFFLCWFCMFMFKCIHSFVLDNISFQTLWSRLQVKNYLRQKTFVAWNFCCFAAEIRKTITIEKIFKNSLVDKQLNKNAFFIFFFPGAGMVKTVISFRKFFLGVNIFVMCKKL